MKIDKETKKLVLAARRALRILGSMPADFDECHELAGALESYSDMADDATRGPDISNHPDSVFVCDYYLPISGDRRIEINIGDGVVHGLLPEEAAELMRQLGEVLRET